MKMTAKQSMSTDLVVVHFEDNLDISWKRMQQARVRHLPVVDDEGKIVGIISDRDFKRAQWPVESSGDTFNQKNPAFRSSSFVGDYMSWPVGSVSYDANLIDVAKKMIEEKISCVVVYGDSKMVGIITHEDLLRVLAALLSEPVSAKERIQSWAYNSQIGQVVNSLSDIGL